MNKTVVYGGILIAIVIAVGGYFFPQIQTAFGASGTRFPNGISADTTSPVAGEVRGTDLSITDDATVSGGSMTVTTTNSATSTLSLGCVQTVATSTATPIRFVIGSSGATTSHNGVGSSNGVVGWQYGSCPI